MSTLIGALAILAGVQTAVAYGVYAERKILARMQHRRGPNRVGFGILANLPGLGRFFAPLARMRLAGLGQPVADGVKLLLKEDIVPSGADRPTYDLAPFIGLTTAFAGFALVPWAPGIVLADLPAGLLILLALGSLSSYAVVLAGWSSNSKYSLLGGMRATAQLLSYEIPYGLALLSVALTAETLRLSEIAAAQSRIWFVFVQPVAFLVALVGAVAETNRAPFDLPEAETELVSGYHTEYSGMRFALFFLAEYAHIYLAAATIAVLFLGGSALLPGVPVGGVPGVLVLCVKVFAIFFFFVWIRATFPRIRYDRLMAFGWKVLLPVALANLAATAAAKVLL